MFLLFALFLVPLLFLSYFHTHTHTHIYIYICLCIFVLWNLCFVHRLTYKWLNKAAGSQVQSTNYLHYPLEAQDPFILLGLSFSKAATHIDQSMTLKINY